MAGQAKTYWTNWRNFTSCEQVPFSILLSHESEGGELAYIGSSPTSLSHGPFFSTANFFSLLFP